MRKSILYFSTSVLVTAAVEVVAQGLLPPCSGSKMSTWTNCSGEKTFHKGWDSELNYSGDFKDGKLHGQGTASWANGGKYVGDFKNGTYDGQGTMTYPNGKRYVGEFKNGRRDGQGVLYRANGSVQRSGSWSNDNEK